MVEITDVFEALGTEAADAVDCFITAIAGSKDGLPPACLMNFLRVVIEADFSL